MQEFYVINDERRLYLYTHDGDEWNLHYIHGDPCTVFKAQDINEKVSDVKTYLMEEYNADSVKDFLFHIVADANASVTDMIMFAFLGEKPDDESLAKKSRTDYVIPIEPLVKDAIRELSSNKDLMIREYGMNYGGYWYSMKGDVLTRQHKFVLTAYTLSVSEILGYIRQEEQTNE